MQTTVTTSGSTHSQVDVWNGWNEKPCVSGFIFCWIS